MKIDNALKEFCEKYDRNAIQSIDDISTDIGLVQNKVTIKGFNMNEAFNSFSSYLRDYVKFMEKAQVEGSQQAKLMENTSREQVMKSFSDYTNTNVIKEEALTYDKLPEFISSFIEGVNTLIDNVDNFKEQMTDAGVDNELIGDINEYVDIFMDKLTESMDPVMDKILWATGYNSKKALFSEEKKKKTVFV